MLAKSGKHGVTWRRSPGFGSGKACWQQDTSAMLGAAYHPTLAAIMATLHHDPVCPHPPSHDPPAWPGRARVVRACGHHRSGGANRPRRPLAGHLHQPRQRRTHHRSPSRLPAMPPHGTAPRRLGRLAGTAIPPFLPSQRGRTGTLQRARNGHPTGTRPATVLKSARVPPVPARHAQLWQRTPILSYFRTLSSCIFPFHVFS